MNENENKPHANNNLKVTLWTNEDGKIVSHSGGLRDIDVTALQTLKTGDRFIMYPEGGGKYSLRALPPSTRTYNGNRAESTTTTENVASAFKSSTNVA